MSYASIRDWLNAQHIPSATGSTWSTSTIVSMLTEQRLEQYAGKGLWNVHDKHTPGRKYKPREEWVFVDGAHPPIITEDELHAALSRRRRSRKTAKYSRANASPYLFTGTNLEADPMFVCAACGKSVIGYRSSSRHWRKYICGTARYKGAAGCLSDLTVDVDHLENEVLSIIRSKYTNRKPSIG